MTQFAFQSVPYGSMYADNVTQTITITATDTNVQVPSGLSAGALTSAFTFQNARELKCNLAGAYEVHWSMSLSSATTNQEAEGFVMLNGAELVYTSSHSEVSIGGVNRPETVSGHGDIPVLAVNDLISLGVNNHTAIHNLVLHHASLTLRKIA